MHEFDKLGDDARQQYLDWLEEHDLTEWEHVEELSDYLDSLE